MSNEPLLNSIREAVVIRPGDRLLLTTERELTHAQAFEIKARVSELMPDVEIIVASGLHAIVERTVPDA